MKIVEKETLVKAICTGNIGELTVETIYGIIHYHIQKETLDKCFDEILKDDNNQDFIDVIERIKCKLWKEVEEGQFAILDEIIDLINNEFEIKEISIDNRERFKELIVCCILDYIREYDIGFYRDLELKIEVEKNAEIIKTIEDSWKNNQKKNGVELIKGTYSLNIDNNLWINYRANEIYQIEKMFEDGQNVVYLYGRPGMGKTTLAKLYANYRWKEKEDKFKSQTYFLEYSGSMKETLKSLLRESQKYNADDVLKYWKEMSPEQRSQIILIIDNFNEDNLNVFNENRFLEELSTDFFKELSNLGIKILITTRLKVNDYVFEVKEIEDTLSLFKLYAGEILDNKGELLLVKSIIDELRGNTLMISLVAPLWKELNFEKKQEILYKIRNCEIKEIDDDTIYKYVKTILDFSSLLENEEMKTIMANATLLPLGGMPKRKFVEMLGLNNLHSLNNLIKMSWIIENGGVIYLHPVVREIFLEQEIVTYTTCKQYCDEIGKLISRNNQFEIRLPYREYAWQIYKIFKMDKDLNLELVELFYDLSDIYDELAQRKRSIEVVRVVEKHLDVYDENLLEKVGRMSGIAYSINNYYEEIQDLDAAKKLLLEAQYIYPQLEINQGDEIRYKEIGEKIVSNLGSNYISRGRYDLSHSREHFEKALKQHETALKLRLERCSRYALFDEYRKEAERVVAISYTNLATTYFYLKDYQKAIEYHKKAYKIRKLTNNKGANENLQRIIGCVIEIYKSCLTVDIKLLQDAIGYYPKLVFDNYDHQLYDSFNINIEYFLQIHSIIQNDRRYEELIDIADEIMDNILRWKSTIEGVSMEICNN